MKLFNRKKNRTVDEFTIPEVPHQHVWKDMPWYMGVHYNGTNKTAGYKIVEPYICITCGERKNITLEEEDYSNISSDERELIFSKVRSRYKKYIKPRAVVEDMINNILLVKDPDYLNTVEVMRGTPHRKCGTSAEMERQNIDLKIEPKETGK
jgi:hypothetical protein